MRNTLVAWLLMAMVAQAAPMSGYHDLSTKEPASEVEQSSRFGWMKKLSPSRLIPWGKSDEASAAEEATSLPAYGTPESQQQYARSLAPTYSSGPTFDQGPAHRPTEQPTIVSSTAPPIAPSPSAEHYAKTLRTQAHEADRLGQFGEAERLYRLAIQTSPQNASAVNDLGLCLARQGRLDESRSALEEAIRLRPDKTLYRNNLATVLVEQGDIAAAKQQLSGVVSPAEASYNIGHLLATKGKSTEAAQLFREAVTLNPDLGVAREALAQVETVQPELSLASLPQPQTASASTPSIVTEPTPAVAEVLTPSSYKAAPAPSFPRLLPPVVE